MVTWDTDLVLSYLKTLLPVQKPSLKMLTYKLITLLALLSGQRTQTLSLLDSRNIDIGVGSIKCRIGDMLKQSKRGNNLAEIRLKTFAPDRRLRVCCHGDEGNTFAGLRVFSRILLYFGLW